MGSVPKMLSNSGEGVSTIYLWPNLENHSVLVLIHDDVMHLLLANNVKGRNGY